MTKARDHKKIQTSLNKAVKLALKNNKGEHATYIPELAQMPLEKTGVSVTLNDGTKIQAGDCEEFYVSLQSAAKVPLLIGLLEEFGQEQVFKWINVEPTGRGFAAIDYSNRFSNLPSNPMINAGAIALCSHIPGSTRDQQIEWLDKWMEKLFNIPLKINHKMYTSELENSDRNLSLAYLMRSNHVIKGDVASILKNYVALCAYETTVEHASYLPMLLANRGCDENGNRVLTEETVKCVTSIMATCGLYNETGLFMVHTGMPAKSSVSGLILAVAIGHGGVATFNPRLTIKGGSVRGQIMLQEISKDLEWHFASL
ncbi:MAG: glutaminase A [Gammaproteobacteria bacterium]